MAESIAVTLTWSPAPRLVHELVISMAQGACVRDVLKQAALLDARFSALPGGCSFGVWNKRVEPDHAVGDKDRVEIYRPLRVDPKVARRERFKKQGAKSAGLFAQRRPGAKAGY